MKTFEDHMCAPAPRCFEGNIQTARLHFFRRDPKQTCHFAWMRGQHHRGGATFVQSVGDAVVSIQSVGIQNNWELRLSNDQSYKLLRFVLHGKPRADSENGLATQNLGKLAVVEVAKAGRASFSGRQRSRHHLWQASGYNWEHILRSGYSHESRSGAQRAT